MRFKKPHVATLDQVTITRDGDTAHIEYRDPSVSSVRLTIGPELAHMTDEEILAEHNRIVRLQEEARREHKYVAVEIPEGRPQIRFSPLSGQWVPRGDVIRCVIDSGLDDECAVFIDDHELNLREFAGMLKTFAGWGARIVFVPDDETAEEPIIEVRDAADRSEYHRERLFVARFYGGWYQRLPERKLLTGDEERDLEILAMRHRGDRFSDIARRSGLSATLVMTICSDYRQEQARYLEVFDFLIRLQENDDIRRRWPRDFLIDSLFMDSGRAANCLNRILGDRPDLSLAELVDAAISPGCHRAGTWQEALPLHQVRNFGFSTYALIIHRLTNIRLGPAFKRYVEDRVDGLRDRLEELRVPASRNPLSRRLREQLKAHMTDLDEDFIEGPEAVGAVRDLAGADQEGMETGRDVAADACLYDLKPDVPGAASPTIQEVLGAFLAEQQGRLTKAAFNQHRNVIQLLTHCLNEFGYQYLDQEEYALFDLYYNARGQEHRDFCELFGPEKIPEVLGEFLNYFMLRKVMGGKSLLKAAGTVTAALSRWMGMHGHITPEDAAAEARTATQAVEELPAVEAFSEALFRYADGRGRRGRNEGKSYDEVVEDTFYVTAVEPGRIHLEGVEDLSLCVNVPEWLSGLCRGSWSMYLKLGRTSKG